MPNVRLHSNHRITEIYRKHNTYEIKLEECTGHTTITPNKQRLRVFLAPTSRLGEDHVPYLISKHLLGWVVSASAHLCSIVYHHKSLENTFVTVPPQIISTVFKMIGSKFHIQADGWQANLSCPPKKNGMILFEKNFTSIFQKRFASKKSILIFGVTRYITGIQILRRPLPNFP